MMWREEIWWRRMPLIEGIGKSASGNRLLKVGKTVGSKNWLKDY